MFNFLGRLAAAHPWKIVAAWLLVAVVVAVAAPPWDSKTHDDDIRFLPERCRSVRAYLLLQRAFPQDVFASRGIFAIERPREPLRPADFALVDRLVADLELLRQEEPELQLGKIVSYRDPLVGRRLNSEDGHCTLIQVSLGSHYLALQTQATVDRAEEIVQKRLAEAGTDAPQLLTTGAAGIGRDLLRASGASLERTTVATVILVIIVLLLVYRAPLLAMVPLVTIALSVWVALRLLALVTLIPGVHLVNISQIFAVVILYGAGIDYCLFLISRYKEELEGGQEKANAIRRSVRAVGTALAASAGTVICGLSLMGFAEFAKVSSCGPAIALALAVALAASLTLTPALLQLLGRSVFWPGKGPQPVADLALGGGEPLAGRKPPLWDWISHQVAAHPLAIWATSVVVLLPLCVLGMNITPAYKPTAELSPTSASIQGIETIQRRFTAGETGPLTILLVASTDWNTPEGRQLIQQVSSGLIRRDNVAEVRSLTQPLGQRLPVPVPQPDSPTVRLLGGLLRNLQRDLGGMLEKVNQVARDYYLAAVADPSGTRHVARLDVILKTEPFEPTSRATLEKIESWLDQELQVSKVPMGWVEAEFYGLTVHARDLAQVTDSDQRRVSILVLGGIFLILVGVIRKIWLSAYLLATVLFSYAATLGATALVASWWSGQPLGQLDWRVPFFLFTILAAVGEDYNILLVSRIMKEQRRHGRREGIRLGLSRTGGTITACGLIMAGTFATLALSGLNTLVQIGFALAFGVLLDTFIVRPFLVPAFLLLVWRDKNPGTAKKETLPLRPGLRRSA